MRTWFILLCVVAVVSTATAQEGRGKAEEPRGEKATDGQGDADPKKAPTDAYAGKTVRNQADGMGLLKSREKRAPKVGQVAPKLRLTTADGKRVIDLQSFRGKRPVVLVFGSST